MLMQDATVETVVSILEMTGEITNPWLTPHYLRYAETLKRLHAYDGPRSAALELGGTKIFQYVLTKLGFETVLGTQFRSTPDQPASKIVKLTADGDVQSTFLTINFEDEPMPLADSSLDLVMCCEVIEHMDVDPMFLMAELNRVIKPGGTLLITTPNSASSQNVWKILQGYRPHFFMQYTRGRSPYRHNFEYDVHALIALTRAAGFEALSVVTVDTFQPADQSALDFLSTNGFPMDHRGDNIFLMANKTGIVVDRWPADIYV